MYAHTGNTFHSPVTLTFDLIFLARLAAAMDHIRTTFGVDSSSRFSFRARTHRERARDAADIRDASAGVGVGNSRHDLRQEVEQGDEEIGAAEVTDHGVHAAEVLAARDGDQHAEHESVAADRQHEDDRLDADLGGDQRLVAPRQRRPHGLSDDVGGHVRRQRRRCRVPLHHAVNGTTGTAGQPKGLFTPDALRCRAVSASRTVLRLVKVRYAA